MNTPQHRKARNKIMTDGGQPTTQSRFRSAVSPQEQTPFPTALKRLIPATTFEKAKKRFEKFSLSKFRDDSPPSNYVPALKAHASVRPADRLKHVQDFQRKRIEQHLRDLSKKVEQQVRKGGAATLSGIRVALPKEKIESILPSYDKKRKAVHLNEVMGLIEKHATGTQFYSKSHPVLDRLALLERVRKFKASLGIHEKGRNGGEKK